MGINKNINIIICNVDSFFRKTYACDFFLARHSPALWVKVSVKKFEINDRMHRMFLYLKIACFKCISSIRSWIYLKLAIWSILVKILSSEKKEVKGRTKADMERILWKFLGGTFWREIFHWKQPNCFKLKLLKKSWSYQRVAYSNVDCCLERNSDPVWNLIPGSLWEVFRSKPEIFNQKSFFLKNKAG